MNSKVYASKNFLNPFEVISVDNFPSQENKWFFFFVLVSFYYFFIILICFFFCDCGVFVVAFAEYLLHGLEIPDDMNIYQMRSRYAVSSYTYSMMKQHDAVESEYEYRKRLNPNKKVKKKVDLEYVDWSDCFKIILWDV